MQKTLKTLKRQERERFRALKGVQDAVPIQTIWEDGIFLVAKNKYAKTYKISDINYAVASREDKEALFLEYSELLNSFDSDATSKITIALRRLNTSDFEREILIPYQADRLDIYREEYNKMLLSKATGSSSMVREVYITISTFKKSIEEAETYFKRVSVDLVTHLPRLGSRCNELDAMDKLRVLHDFYRTGEEAAFTFDMESSMRKGHSFKDFITPDSLEFNASYFKMGNRYGRVLFLRDYASYIKDSFISELTELSRNLMLSIDVIPVPTDEAVREVENRLLGVETNITTWTRKQNQNQNYNVVVPYDMEQQRKESREFLDDLVTRDQRMMFAALTLVHTADTLEELDSDTEAILTTARKHLCQMSVLKYQQLDGLNTALPIGVRKIEALRTLTTESLAVLVPFRVQEIMDKGGNYFGENTISHNMILCNKSNLLNPNGFIFGVPGAGKSFLTKQHITELALSTQDDIIICDPEREYMPLIHALGGTVIEIAAGSGHFINAMDMVEGYGDSGSPVIEKSQFILSLFAQLNNGDLKPQAKSIIDRCVAAVFADYKNGGELPTLVVLRDKLLSQSEPEAHELALSLELFTSGSLDAFAHPTNVDVSNRIVVYDIMDLGETLKTMGLLVITDSMINRVVENWRRGKRTHLFIDEFHCVFSDPYSAEFFASAWRRFRKRNAVPTAITQNVNFLLQNETATSMLSNSEFIVMLNQAASDRDRLAHHLHISAEQMGYITNAEAGSGLIRYGSQLVPFVNKFPKNTKLYKLMTTKPLDISDGLL
jgi:type IV secretory pathway VirB4 component